MSSSNKAPSDPPRPADLRARSPTEGLSSLPTAAPIRFGIVTSLDDHRSRSDLVTARTLCDDGSTVNVVAREVFVADLLNRHGKVMVAFLHRPRDAYARVLAARALHAAWS